MIDPNRQDEAKATATVIAALMAALARDTAPRRQEPTPGAVTA